MSKVITKQYKEIFVPGVFGICIVGLFFSINYSLPKFSVVVFIVGSILSFLWWFPRMSKFGIILTSVIILMLFIAIIILSKIQWFSMV